MMITNPIESIKFQFSRNGKIILLILPQWFVYCYTYTLELESLVDVLFIFTSRLFSWLFKHV